MRIVGDQSPHSDRFTASPQARAQVAVVDDHLLIGRLVVSLLERAGYTAAHAYGETSADTWAQVEAIAPELLLLDFDLGSFHSALDILERAVAAGIQVAGFTGSDDVVEHARFLEGGAAAVVPKSGGPADLVAVVELALAGQELTSPADRHEALSRLRLHREEQRRELAAFSTLTDREAETLRLLAEGEGAAEIAEICQIAMPTVRSHIRAVLTKLGVSSQLRAVAIAHDSGWYEIISGDRTSSILMMSRQEETGRIARQGGSQG